MKFSEQWLREWINPPLTVNELGQKLTMAGLEVSSIEAAAATFTHVIVGQVMAITSHPQADRLRICQVEIGQPVPLSIICGAKTIHKQGKYPVALVGASLPGKRKIKLSKIRGESSQGMLCSATELKLGEDSEGILQLPDDAPIGMDVRSYMQLEDQVIDLEITPNRGDCLSIQGIAREVSVLTQAKITAPQLDEAKPLTQETLDVRVISTDACPQYLGRIIRNINPNATTPLWMQERLRRSGIRAISPIVDVTNYTMLELGQPLHAFDLNRLDKAITVRYATTGEKITLLDGQEVTLDAQTQVIADAQKPQAIAGVMGSSAAAVTESTTDIFLESAFFNPVAVAHCVRLYSINSESAYRFERGVDPEQQMPALQRATQLLLEIAGGEPGPITKAMTKTHLPKPPTIHLRRARIPHLLGFDIPDTIVESILKQLGMHLKPTQQGWQVTVPSYRSDLSIEADLIEELIRIHGYHQLPSHQPTATLQSALSQQATINQQLYATLVNRGYQEAITYSFVDSTLLQSITPHIQPIALQNPIAAHMNVMRTSLWLGLLQAVVHNQHRQQMHMRLFEKGLVFIPKEPQIKQVKMLAGVVAGHVYQPHWGLPQRSYDFFDIKADVEAFLAILTNSSDYHFSATTEPTLHPQESAKITQGDTLIGHLGALHPALQKSLAITTPVYLFELVLDNLPVPSIPQFKPLSKFPTIRRDIAIIVPIQVSYQNILEKIYQEAGKLLKDVRLFDLYVGEKVKPGYISMALSLIFQDQARTLKENEVNKQVKHIVNSLTKAFNATIRN